MNFYNKIEYNKRLNTFKVDIYLKLNKASLNDLLINDDDFEIQSRFIYIKFKYIKYYN